MTDETRRADSHAGASSVEEKNIKQLLRRAYDPAEPGPAFVQRLTEDLLAAATAQNRPLAALRGPWIWRVGAVAAAVAVGVMIGALLETRPDDGAPCVHPVGSVLPRPIDMPARPAGLVVHKPAARSVPVENLLRPREAPRPVPARRAKVGETVRTGPFERKRVTLPDGSTVYLNADTMLVVNTPRTVSLGKGEVYLHVAPQSDRSSGPARPFRVRAGQRQVTALGTRFGVRLQQAGPGVAVTQGKVRVSGTEGVLEAGRRLGPDAAGTSPLPRASHVLDWTRDLVVASRTPLVPASEHAGGSLVVRDADGQASRLSLRKFHVDVHVEDGFARTTIDQTYFNHTPRRLEGTFYFPLPADASLSRLAMYVNGRLMEGGMVERRRAREVFEEIVRKMRDPALLEWIDGTTFKMRVFPLEGRQEKRIVLSYTQRLGGLYGRTSYRFPAGHSMEKVGAWSFRARVKGGAKLAWESPTHRLTAARQGEDLVLEAEARNAAPHDDVVVNLRDEADDAAAMDAQSAAFSSAQHETGSFLMLRFRPNLPAPERKQRRHWVFLLESSADRDPLLARTQIEVFRGMMENAEHDDTFCVLTAGTRPRVLDETPRAATAANVDEAVAWLDRTHLIGALDLEAALTAAAELAQAGTNAHIVHLGTGVPALGERDREKLLGLFPDGVKYIGVGVGKRWSRGFMKAAATRTGCCYTQINPDEPILWRAFELLSTLNTPRLMNVRVTGAPDGRAFLLAEDSVAQGEQLCAVLRADNPVVLPTAVRVTGTLDGRDWSAELPVAAVAEGADYLPRIWARMEIDRLVAEGAARNHKRIVELSKAMYVMSPFTSLLVLEDEAMYERYGVDRGRKDHWALYPCPPTVPIVHEPLTGEGRAPAPRRGQPAKPPATDWRRETLNSLIVRPAPGFLQPAADRGWRESAAFLPGSPSVPRFSLPDRDGDGNDSGKVGDSDPAGFYWDFSGNAGVGYSWQAPVRGSATPGNPLAWQYVPSVAPSDEWLIGAISPVEGQAIVNGAGTLVLGGQLSINGNAVIAGDLTVDLNGGDTGVLWLGDQTFTTVAGGRLSLLNILHDLDGFAPNGTTPGVDRVETGFVEVDTTVPGSIPLWAGDLDYGAELDADSGSAGRAVTDRVGSPGPWTVSEIINCAGADGSVRILPVKPPTRDHTTVSAPPSASDSRRGGRGTDTDLGKAEVPWYQYLRYPKSWKQLTEDRKEFVASAADEGPADAEARKKLRREIERLRFADIDLKDVLQFLREYGDVNIHVNWRALTAAGIEENTKVSVDVREISVKRALDLILRDVSGAAAGADAELRYVLDGGVLTVSTKADLAREPIRRVYDVRDLLRPEPGFQPPPRRAPRPSDGIFEGEPSGIFGEPSDALGLDEDLLGSGVRGLVSLPDFLGQRALDPVVEADSGYVIDSGGGLFSDELAEDGVAPSPTDTEEMSRRFRRLIINAVDRDSWGDPEFGGAGLGFIQIIDGQMVITQTAENHQAIADLLEKMRRTHRQRPPRAILRLPGGVSERDELGRQHGVDLRLPGVPHSPVYDRPTFCGREDAFTNLTLYAPALSMRRADVRAALESAAPPVAREKLGEVDPNAAKLIEAARRQGFRKATVPGTRGRPALTVTFDGAGRYAYDRRLPTGLRERMFCDGQLLQHVYPELGLAVRRKVSRFHRAEAGRLLPMLVPPATDLAVGADVTVAGERTVVVTPKAKPAKTPGRAMHLVFAEDGRLAVRRVVAVATGETVLRQTISPAGVVTLLDGTGRALGRTDYRLGPADAPDLKVDAGKLVVLSMPLRNDTFRALAGGRRPWVSKGEALQFIAAAIASGHARGSAADLLRRLTREKDDERLGLYVLLWAAGRKPELPTDLADLPAAKYLRIVRNGLGKADWTAVRECGTSPDEFFPRLAGFARLWHALRKFDEPADEPTQEDLHKWWWSEAGDYVREAGPCEFSWAVLAEAVRLAEASGQPALHGKLVEWLDRFADHPRLGPYARYEAARALYNQGRGPIARIELKKLYRQMAARGLPLWFDETMYRVTRGHGWREMILDAAEALLRSGRCYATVELAWHCRRVGDPHLGAELLRRARDKAPEGERLALKLAAVKYHCHVADWPQASVTLDEAMKDERIAAVPALWRAAGWLAAKQGKVARSILCEDRALDLEYGRLGETVDVRPIRARYGGLLKRYGALARVISSLSAEPPREMVAGIVRAADRWRQIDTDPKAACHAAATALRRIGADDLAWDYLTTPLAAKPNEAESWTDLAKALDEQGDLHRAGRSYETASELAPDNPQILWDHATMLEKRGRAEEALALYGKIAERNWPVGHRAVGEAAKKRLAK